MLYFVGAPKISAGGRRMVNMVNVTPLHSVRYTVYSTHIVRTAAT